MPYAGSAHGDTPEEVIKSPGNGLPDSCELLSGCWELDLGRPLEE